uniref:Guanylate cyclase domain-containing protein n=1 Tax=Hemiselmis andersenii TaxID=464988 RepID=A0A6U4KX40_HEMAN|mmetsp:Transcript_7784/g.17871  ORF Transcript_7784/g.17871 Transcript_7784/m.17871 type:complete len:560 (+) Transcript_7784:51-1730(+)
MRRLESATRNLASWTDGLAADEVPEPPPLLRRVSGKREGLKSAAAAAAAAAAANDFPTTFERIAPKSLPRAISEVEISNALTHRADQTMMRVTSEPYISDEESPLSANVRYVESDEGEDGDQESATSSPMMSRSNSDRNMQTPQEPEAPWKMRLKKSGSGEIWKRLLARGRGSAANVWTPLHQQIFLVCEVMIVSESEGTRSEMMRVMESVGDCKTVICESTEDALETCRKRSFLPDILCADECSAHTVRCLEEVFSEATDINLILLVSRLSLPTHKQLEGAHDYACIDDPSWIVAERVKGQVSSKRAELMQFDAMANKKLLESVFPSNIIKQLKRRGSVGSSPGSRRRILQKHDCVTLLFSDVVDYTDMSMSSGTDEIVALLDTLFTAFDALCEKHNVRKVETIGDAYMVVGGDDGAKDHASKVLAMGMNMIECVKKIKLPRSEEHVKIRIGIHSGPVSSGVVGRKCPRFCFFGDTVNTASRMESYGFPMACHLSEGTYRLLCHLAQGDSPSYKFVSCGKHHIKGKGEMQTFVAALPEQQVNSKDISNYQAFRRTTTI